MYYQSYSGETATQIEGANPYEIADKKCNNYYLQKATSKKCIPLPAEQYEYYEEVINSQQASLTEPLLELESDIIPEEVSKPEVNEDPPKVIKKHSFNIYPEMDAEDYSALKNDIQNNGYDPKYPIWLYQGGILDGWNRQMICSELKIKPIYQNFIGTDTDALSFVIRSNNRRNLNSSQRACLAQDYNFLFEKIKKEAKERQIEGGKTKVRQKIAEPKRDDNKTNSKIAKLCGTNRTYVQKAGKIKNENPEMFEKIKSGAETISNYDKKAVFTGENECFIPKEFIEKVKAVFDKADLNPAFSDEAQETVLTTPHYSTITNELDKNWNGNVFVNPPNSTTKVAAYINRFIEEYNSGHINQGIILTNNSTHADWFHKLMKIAQLACFTDGSMKLQHNEKKANLKHGHVFFYVGINENKFIEKFKDLGLVMRKV
jgi:hypothetical protein